MSYECPRCGHDVWDDCTYCGKDARIAELEADYAVASESVLRLGLRLAAVTAICDERDQPGPKCLDFDEETARFRAAATGQ